MKNYERHPSLGIRGSGLSIHGAKQLFYTKLSDCAAACNAAADCGAFVHSRSCGVAACGGRISTSGTVSSLPLWLGPPPLASITPAWYGRCLGCMSSLRARVLELTLWRHDYVAPVRGIGG